MALGGVRTDLERLLGLDLKRLGREAARQRAAVQVAYVPRRCTL